jgi:hypothetical protein
MNTRLLESTLQRGMELQNFFNSSETCLEVARFAVDESIVKLKLDERTYIIQESLDNMTVVNQQQTVFLNRHMAMSLLVHKVCEKFANDCLKTQCVFAGVHHPGQDEDYPPVYRLVAYTNLHQSFSMVNVKHGDEHVRLLRSLPEFCTFIDFIIQMDGTWRMDVGQMDMVDLAHIEYVFRPAEKTMNVAVDLPDTTMNAAVLGRHVSLCQISQTFFCKMYNKDHAKMSAVDWQDGILEFCLA